MTFNKLLNYLHWLLIRPIESNIFASALALGAGTNLLGSYLGGKSAERAARTAANASLFRPVSIDTGLGSVTATGTPGNVGFETALSPELQAIRDQLLGIGTTGLEQFQTFDPNQAAALFTQQLNQVAQPQEQQQQLQLENRLFQQGLLGGTTGQNRMEALNTAQGFAQNQRNLQGLQYGTDEQARLFQNALGGIQGATALDQMLAQQLGQSIAAGGAQTAANVGAADFQFQAGMNQADAISGFFGNLGTGLANYAYQPPPPSSQGLFVQPNTSLSINPYTVDTSQFNFASQ